MYTPKFTVATLEGCPCVMCYGVVIEDEVTFTPLMAQDLDDCRFTGRANALACWLGFTETKCFSARLWMRCNKGQKKLFSSKGLVGHRGCFPLESAQLVKLDGP